MIPTVERIVLPWFETESTSERDLLSLNYASTRALPILSSVEDAFKKSLEVRVEAEAREEVGFLGGLIETTFEREYVLGEHAFLCRVAREEKGPTPKALLGRVLPYVERCRDDPLSRLGKKVVVHDGARYVDPNAFISLRKRLDADVEEETKTSIDHGWVSREAFTLDERIDKLDIVPVPDAHRKLSDANAQTHYLVKSIKKRFDSFVKEAKTRIKSEYGVSPDASNVVHVPLDDRSLYRLLPLEKQSVSYAPIIAGILGPKTPKGSITKTTGDLVIARELGYDADYERRGASGLRVTHEIADDRTRTLTISRPGSTRSYRMIEENDTVFVRVDDLVAVMSDLTNEHTKTADNTKHEFLPAIPEYLSNA